MTTYSFKNKLLLYYLTFMTVQYNSVCITHDILIFEIVVF